MFGFSARRFNLLVSLIALVGMLSGVSLASVIAEPGGGGAGGAAAELNAVPALHNPRFDNQDWYEFKDRYGNYLAGSWLPDDDNNKPDTIPLETRQDWRVWYLQGRDVLEVDPEAVYAHQGEAVQMRAYGDSWNSGSHFGGLYQPVYNVIPCLHYKFTMYGQARYEPPSNQIPNPMPTDWVNAMQVGIDPTGWALSTNDPAVHGSFPATTVWGASAKYYWNYGQLSVTAEAHNTKITVFTYADATGGRASRVLWDIGALEEATPALIYDPAAYSPGSGITGLGAFASGGNATITWNSPAGISQVFYRIKSGGSGQPTEPMSYTVYLPLVINGDNWQYSLVDKTASTTHNFVLTGLRSGMYEYFVVTRGLSGDQCANWVSEKREFVMP